MTITEVNNLLLEFKKILNYFSGCVINGPMIGGLISPGNPENVPYVCDFYIGSIPYAAYFRIIVLNDMITVGLLMSPDLVRDCTLQMLPNIRGQFISKFREFITDAKNYREKTNTTVVEYFSGKYNMSYSQYDNNPYVMSSEFQDHNIELVNQINYISAVNKQKAEEKDKKLKEYQNQLRSLDERRNNIETMMKNLSLSEN